MSNLCEKLLSKCIGADCANMPFTGLGSKAYIANKSEIESVTYDASNPNLVTAITMKEIAEDTDAVLYEVQQLGKTPFTSTTTTFNANDNMNNFTEVFNFIYPDNGADAAQTLDMLANGKFVAIVNNEFAGSDGTATWQILGLKKGLVATDINRDPYSEDAQGGWVCQFTAENTPNSAIFIQHTDTSGSDPVVDTEAYLDSLTDCD